MFDHRDGVENQSGVTVESTPEMIEAGCAVPKDSRMLERWSSQNVLVVTEMRQAALVRVVASEKTKITQC